MHKSVSFKKQPTAAIGPYNFIAIFLISLGTNCMGTIENYISLGYLLRVRQAHLPQYLALVGVVALWLHYKPVHFFNRNLHLVLKICRKFETSVGPVSSRFNKPGRFNVAQN